jgi:hypothetical protein
MKIVYQTESGVVILNPTGELSIADTARKDVPQGIPFIIVESSVLPEDPITLDVSLLDFTTPDGYGDPASYWVEQQSVLD